MYAVRNWGLSLNRFYTLCSGSSGVTLIRPTELLDKKDKKLIANYLNSPSISHEWSVVLARCGVSARNLENSTAVFKSLDKVFSGGFSI